MDAKSLAGEPLRILLVEDDPAHATLVKRSFESHRVANKLFHVSDGERALNYLLRKEDYSDPATSPTPHLILLDLRLPKVDGLQVLEIIKSHESTRTIPVVILTTSSADRDVNAAYSKHVNSYLVKPVDFEKFSQLMTELGFYWLGWNFHPWA